MAELSQEAFFNELLNDFRVESAEHCKIIENGLLRLEQNSGEAEDRQLLETTFREFHSLKGAARAVSQFEIERICQVCESVFHQLKQKSAQPGPSMFDLLHKALDILKLLINEVDSKTKSVGQGMLTSLFKAIEKSVLPLEAEAAEFDVRHAASPETALKEVIPDEPVGAVGVISASAEQAVVQNFPDQNQKDETIRVSTSKLNILLRQAEEFIALKSVLSHYLESVRALNHPELHTLEWDMVRTNAAYMRMVDDLIHQVKSVMLHPFASVLDIVPRMVRDLAKEYRKEIEINISGADILIDRRILEGLKDPLLHLMRNCVDHGIEKPDDRIKAGKPAKGNIEIKVNQESGKLIELIISDDGGGIDPEKVRASALKNGIIAPDSAAQLNSKELQQLIFRSGISTSPFITDISGRGLGMAIVAEKIVAMGGSILLDSTPGKGTTFTISLPLTLSTFRGVVVKVSGMSFIIPTNAIERAFKINPEDLRLIGLEQFIKIHDENVPVFSLSELLSIPAKPSQRGGELLLTAVLLNHSGRKVVCIVDGVESEQEGVVKELGPQIRQLRAIAGATISGNGSVIPIIDLTGLIKLCETASSDSNSANTKQVVPDADEQLKNILIAEDSITSRTLIRNVLETAGYRVRAAVDGAEAFRMLMSEPADLVVSDVEMPHINGFELTAKIRSTERYRNLPVILVTALSTDIDKQRGLDAGANAYIVKGNFEESNLLATIERLI